MGMLQNGFYRIAEAVRAYGAVEAAVWTLVNAVRFAWVAVMEVQEAAQAWLASADAITDDDVVAACEAVADAQQLIAEGGTPVLDVDMLRQRAQLLAAAQQAQQDCQKAQRAYETFRGMAEYRLAELAQKPRPRHGTGQLARLMQMARDLLQEAQDAVDMAQPHMPDSETQKILFAHAAWDGKPDFDKARASLEFADGMLAKAQAQYRTVTAGIYGTFGEFPDDADAATTADKKEAADRIWQ